MDSQIKYNFRKNLENAKLEKNRKIRKFKKLELDF